MPRPNFWADILLKLFSSLVSKLIPTFKSRVWENVLARNWSDIYERNSVGRPKTEPQKDREGSWTLSSCFMCVNKLQERRPKILIGDKRVELQQLKIGQSHHQTFCQCTFWAWSWLKERFSSSIRGDNLTHPKNGYPKKFFDEVRSRETGPFDFWKRHLCFLAFSWKSVTLLDRIGLRLS